MAKRSKPSSSHSAASRSPDAAPKRPIDIDEMFGRISAAIRPFKPAAMFELAEEGLRSPFEQLVACMISIRTRDETTVPTARKLFAAARTPREMAKLTWQQIDQLIRASSFHEPKANQILSIAQHLVAQHKCELPCDEEVLLALPGVGPKCAHLVLGIACGQKHISVDIHVHRVTHRWGYAAAKTPEQTMAQLQTKLPKKYWVQINRLLVPFGKHICTGTLPRCSTSPVLEMCRQVGVDKHR